MRLTIILFLLSLKQIFSFKILHNIKINENFIQIQNKANSFIKLSRAKNIIPTAFLSFSGGYLVNPSIT